MTDAMAPRLIPDLNQDVEQDILSYLYPHDVSQVARCSKGGNASVDRYRRDNPDWYVTYFLRKEGIPVEAEKVRKIWTECELIWGTKKEEWDRACQREDQHLCDLERSADWYSKQWLPYVTGLGSGIFHIGMIAAIMKCAKPDNILLKIKPVVNGIVVSIGYSIGHFFILTTRKQISRKHFLASCQARIRERQFTQKDLQGRIWPNNQAWPVKDERRPASLDPSSDLYVMGVRWTPLRELQYVYNIDELGARGLLTKNQFVAAKLLIGMDEAEWTTWLERVQTWTAGDWSSNTKSIGLGWRELKPGMLVGPKGYLLRESGANKKKKKAQFKKHPRHLAFTKMMIQEDGLISFSRQKDQSRYYIHPVFKVIRDPVAAG